MTRDSIANYKPVALAIPINQNLQVSNEKPEPLEEGHEQKANLTRELVSKKTVVLCRWGSGNKCLATVKRIEK